MSAHQLFAVLLGFYGILAVVEAQTEATTSTKGPCGETLPCVPGTTYGQPESCDVYYECADDGNSFLVLSCPRQKQFDHKRGSCRGASKARCLQSCGTTFVPKDSERTPTVETAAEPVPEDETLEPQEVPLEGPKVEKVSKEELITKEEAEKVMIEEEAGSGTDVMDPVMVITDAMVPNATDASTDKLELSSVAEEEKNPVRPDNELVEDKTDTTTKKEEPTSKSVIVPTAGQPPVPSSGHPADPTSGPPRIVIPESGEPGYGFVTEEMTTSGVNDSIIGGGEIEGGATGLSTATIGIIAGALGGLVLLVLVVLIVLLCFRRRRFHKHHDIEKFENPQYSRPERPGPKDFRFSRESTLYVGPTVNFHQLNNNQSPSTFSAESPCSTAERKKRQAPPPPPSPLSASGKKRPAPPPPAFLGQRPEDFYEKDSLPGSTDNIAMSTFAVRNPTAKLNFDEAEDDDKSLLVKTPESNKTPREPTPEPRSATPVEESKEPLLNKSVLSEAEKNGSNGHTPRAESEEGEEREEEKNSLLQKKKDFDGLSVDSYDIENNPFFADD